MSLPNSHYQIVITRLSLLWHTKMSLPNCHYHIVVTKLSLPNCHYQIVITKFFLSNYHYQIIINKFLLSNFYYQIIITKLILPKIRTSIFLVVCSHYTNLKYIILRKKRKTLHFFAKGIWKNSKCETLVVTEPTRERYIHVIRTFLLCILNLCNDYIQPKKLMCGFLVISIW